MAARFTAVTLIVLAGIALLWAALHLWIGRALGGYSPRARLLALGLAVVNLVCCRSAPRSAPTPAGCC